MKIEKLLETLLKTSLDRNIINLESSQDYQNRVIEDCEMEADEIASYYLFNH